jgi:hypothetical protein
MRATVFWTYSAAGRTCRPLYVPHEEQALWLITGSLQDGQRVTFGGLTFQWARR